MFWHDAALVFSRRSSPAAMLDSPLPTRRQGDIRLPSQSARIAICGRFPDPVRCVCWHCLLTKPDAYPTHGRSACCSGWFASWPGSQDGQRMSQTDFSDSLQPAGHCFRVPMTHRGAGALCAVVRVMTPGFPCICEVAGLYRDSSSLVHTHIQAVPGSSNAHAVEVAGWCGHC